MTVLAAEIASEALQYAPIIGGVSVVAGFLTYVDKRESRIQAHNDEQQALATKRHDSDIALIRTDLEAERAAHAATQSAHEETRLVVVRLSAETAMLRERSEKCERDHTDTKETLTRKLNELQGRMDMLLTPKPRTPRKKSASRVTPKKKPTK